jgi:hypothetical protein
MTAKHALKIDQPTFRVKNPGKQSPFGRLYFCSASIVKAAFYSSDDPQPEFGVDCGPFQK